MDWCYREQSNFYRNGRHLLNKKVKLLNYKIMSTVKTFEVGKRYFMRSACNYEVVWVYTVISRTKKFVTLQDDKGRVRRRGVYVYRNEECANPLGSFSMAPVLAADNVVKDKVISEDNTNEEEISENVHTALIIPIR